MFPFVRICYSLLLLTPLVLGNTQLSLSNDDWILSDSEGVRIQAKVPGSQYTALLSKGKIEDPLYRNNDIELQPVALKNWVYSLEFSAPANLVSYRNLTLQCKGLDTIAKVILNNETLGYTDNMFVHFAFDVSGKLKKDNNVLRVEFTSAVAEAKSRADAAEYVIPPECPPEVLRGQCHVNQIRKEQCSFAWDWGPSFPTQGIWRPIYIDAFNSAIIRDVGAVVIKGDTDWQVEVEVSFDVYKGEKVNGRLEASIMDVKAQYSENIALSTQERTVKFNITVPKDSVSLWWPRGYGQQKLYTINVTFASGHDLCTRFRKIGFRTIELFQIPVNIGPKGAWADTKKSNDLGLTFYFVINSLPIYLKGSNWIPADNFQERITFDRLNYLLTSAADVGINSMRVWGGGIYEPEDFYDLCDQLGILVWQDLMFSVAMYPADQKFLDSVAAEVRYQINRLKHHPSILVWAGNNENEKALVQNWFGTKENYQRYFDDYIKLYVTTIQPIVESCDSTREYITSSPTNGAKSVQEGYVAKEPWSELYGDIHFYDYAADQWNPDVFRIPRMASEYGIQAWCNNESLASVFAQEDYDVSSKMVDHRQHHGKGNQEMTDEVKQHLTLPKSSDPKEYFAEFVYLTQINQAMSMRTQTEHYRRYQTRLLEDGRGLNMGALYWQLNDIWQAPTWASIDYEGRWKMLHYFARAFFDKNLISPYKLDANTLDVYMVVDEIPIVAERTETGTLAFFPLSKMESAQESELPWLGDYLAINHSREVIKGNLKIEMFDYSNFESLKSWNVPYQFNQTAASVFTKPISELLSESGCPGQERCMLYFTATDQSGAVLSSTWFMLTYPKDAALIKPTLKIEKVVKLKPLEFEITLSSDVPAVFVWLAADNVKGHFSDNGFHMLSMNKKVQFFPQQPVDALALKSQLSVRSVHNSNSVSGLKATVVVALFSLLVGKSLNYLIL